MQSDFFFDSSPLWSQKTHGNRAFAFDAFISHATGDKSSAIVEELRRHGVSVWHDESQEMGDATWRSRLVGALVRSRYVVLALDAEHDILEREWVTAEWQSALEAERLSGVQRLVIASRDGAHLPQLLSMHPQFNLPRQSEALARMLKEGNLLPQYVIINGGPPSFSDIYVSLRKAALREAEGSEALQLYDLIGEGLVETQSNQNHPSHAVYILWVFSHDSQALDKLDINSLGLAVQGLEALAITGHSESRANSCFMLRALAKKGSTTAGEALRRILRREDHADVLKLVYGWFLKDGKILPPLTREDYARLLLVLPSFATELVDKASESAPPEADPAKLRHAAFRSTHKHFESLKPVPKRNEAERRFQMLLETKASPTTWEIFFRGVAKDAELEIPIIDLASPMAEQCVNSFMTLVERFVDEVAGQLANRLWVMEYEVAILQPLAMTYSSEQFGERPLFVYRKFLEALKIPVSKDLELIEEWHREQPTAEDAQFANLLREELEARLAFIAFYLEGPHVERKADGLLYVDLLNSTRRVDIMKTSKKLHLRRTFLEFQEQPLARYEGRVRGGGSKHPTIVSLWDRWDHVSLI